MSFPQTRLTLIQRLNSGGSEEDWRLFLNDYWGPICRFALRWGAHDLNDAEDVAAQTFKVLLENRLLVRWVSHRSAKLRTLLCGVVRNILSNRHRVRASRDHLLGDMIQHIDELSPAHSEEVDAFYVAWAEDLVQRSVELLASEYYRQNKGDYVRVLYGRLCERLRVVQVAKALEIKPSDVVNYYRHARQKLSQKLEDLVRGQIQRYCPPDEVQHELACEWRQLGQYLAEHGGLEAAVQRAYDLLDPVRAQRLKGGGLPKTATHLSSITCPRGDATSSRETS